MKILLAEDTRDMNYVLTAALTHEGYDVDSAFDGEEALDFVRTNGYDAMVLDIMMPKKDGLQVLKELREENIVTPVLLLTAKAEVDDRVNGLDAGADDYLTKPFAMKELLARVRAMTRRKTEYAAKKLQYGDFSLDDEKFELSCENSVRLSVKEFELLQYLMENKSLVMTRNQILCHVWGYDFDGETRTVDVHVRTLRQKLGEAGDLIETVRGVGYRIGE